MSKSMPRMEPLPREEWTEEARDFFGFYSGPRGRENGSPSNLIMTLANHPPAASAYMTFGFQVLRRSELPDRVRELVTLRVAWLHQCDYEWLHHERYARKLGMTSAEIEAIKEGGHDPIWSGIDRAVLLATDQLTKEGRLSDELWADLARDLNKRQLIDLIFTMGNYTMVAWLFAALQIQPDAKPSLADTPFAEMRGAAI